MLKLATFGVAVATMAMATPASASIDLFVSTGSSVYAGPTPTITFDPAAPGSVSGGTVVNGTDMPHAQPLGSTGNYWSVGPTDGTPGYVDLTGYSPITSLSFIWGSVDTYNLLEFLDASDNILASFSGNQVNNPANGDQSSPFTNPLVTFYVSGSDSTNLARLRLSATDDAFEIDNVAINAVPEPATWALMLLGFGGMGVAMRRRRSTAVLPQVA